MEENWENKLPIVESNCNVKFSLIHLLYTSDSFCSFVHITSNVKFSFVHLLYTSDSHYTFCSFCSHHKCVEVINDPGGSTAPLQYITHGSLRRKTIEDGKLQCFFFLFFSFFFFKKKAAVLLCTQTLQPKG